MLVVVALVLTAVAGPAAAHFSLTVPPTRLFDELEEINAPCGGGNTPSATRTVFTKDSKVTIKFADKQGTASVFLGIGENPTTFPIKVGELTMSKFGDYDIPLDFSSVPAANAKSPATIQVIVNSDGALYQCGDVTLNLATATPASSSSSAVPPKTSSAPAATTAPAKTTDGGYATSKPSYPTDGPILSGAKSTGASAVLAGLALLPLALL
ncbi:hypothetical protein HK105_204166 [Polyrhizophydium stewartii]|uniref:Copper acquisition factor BIM1-like domain-containing protein n=1 Tax=Polyrhizophydium stewartii TaxID=2732419 RepID=A0ABR4NA69_9FUNG|nr:hypothetical protein HK105_002725 [Polyrhizophydium stewartii]